MLDCHKLFLIRLELFSSTLEDQKVEGYLNGKIIFEYSLQKEKYQLFLVLYHEH